MKILSGRDLAGYVKARQARVGRRLAAEGRPAKLVIIRDSENPVIAKYVELKRRYGADIGVEVEDVLVGGVGTGDGGASGEGAVVEDGLAALKGAVARANEDESVSGVIVQLPLVKTEWTDEVVGGILPEKDVDGLGWGVKGEAGLAESGGAEVADSTQTGRKFESATATAIQWLLSGYDVELRGKKLAVVGRGRLVGAPLLRMWRGSGLDVEEFGRDSDLNELVNYDVIVTATGVPHLIKSEMVKPGTVVVDAGTASEGGVLVGDVDEGVRARADLGAITPVVGGVGPLTVSVLFEHVLVAGGGE